MCCRRILQLKPPKLWPTCILLTDKSDVYSLILKNVDWKQVEINYWFIFHVRWRSLSITYKLTAGELPIRAVFLRGCFTFTPPGGSVKWTKLAWACLIKHPEFHFTLPMAECSSCVKSEPLFLLRRTPSFFGSATWIYRTSYCVDQFVVICFCVHIRDWFCEHQLVLLPHSKTVVGSIPATAGLSVWICMFSLVKFNCRL